MNINEKKIYIRANELYKEGKTAEAIKLWASINHSKKSVISVEPIIWKLKHISHFIEVKVSIFAFYSLLVLLSFFFGPAAYYFLWCFGDLVSSNSYPEIHSFFLNLSIDEHVFIDTVSDPMSIAPFFEKYTLASQQYIIGKVIHTQAYFFTSNEQLSLGNPISSLIFNSSFGLTIALVSLAAVGSLYIQWKLLKGISNWLYQLLKLKEFRIRFCLAATMAFICFCFFDLVYKKFEKPPELPTLAQMSSTGQEGENAKERSGSNGQGQKEGSEKSEKKFLEEFTKELSRTPYSLKERAAITKIYNDYIKMLKKYGIKSGESTDEPSVQKIIEIMKSGKFSEIENSLKKIKAMKEYKKLQGENGEGDGEMLAQDDKDFAEVLKKSFMSSDKKTLEEYIKTSNELEQLYGKEIKNKVFSGSKRDELIQKFAADPQKAREFAREETNKILEGENFNERSFLGSLEMDVMTRINSIINYLECGGDIKVFNQMRVQFLKDYDSPEIRFNFAMRIDFVMASWNEHQSKYFWQMNRALTMEIVDMLTEAAKAVNFDIRETHLGWFYLVAGYYEKAREECLKSVQLEDARGDTEGEGAYVNRSNAALAALMMNQGKTAFIEYRWIYKKVLEKKGYLRNKREELFSEYIREITAALASPSPCKEAYLCRSMFLEDVDDELALSDLLKYLAFSPEDELLLREANLKVKLIKARLEKRKSK